MFNMRRSFRAVSIIAVSAFVLLTTSGCSLLDAYYANLNFCIYGCELP